MSGFDWSMLKAHMPTSGRADSSAPSSALSSATSYSSGGHDGLTDLEWPSYERDSSGPHGPHDSREGGAPKCPPPTPATPSVARVARLEQDREPPDAANRRDKIVRR